MAPYKTRMLTYAYDPRVFLIEGVATIAFAGLIFYIYPDYPKSPRSAKWLTPREQEFLEMRLTENAPRTQDAAFSWKEIVQTVKDPRIWSFMLAQVCYPNSPTDN